MKKKLFIIAGIIVLILAAALISITDGLKEGANIQINSIDLSTIPDGSYTGTFTFKRWTNTLIVHIKDHEITAIEIDRDVSAAQIADCADEIFRRVMEAQDTQVDVVSGATVTSKAYLKAIENALNK